MCPGYLFALCFLLLNRRRQPQVMVQRCNSYSGARHCPAGRAHIGHLSRPEKLGFDLDQDGLKILQHFLRVGGYAGSQKGTARAWIAFDDFAI